MGQEPVSSQSSLRSKSKTGKRKVFKTVFESPYHQWPKIEESLVNDILNRLLAELSRHTSTLSRSTRKVDMHQNKKPRIISENCPVMVGLNQVTRSLERNLLSMVFACKDDVEFGQIFHHLPFQSRLCGSNLVSLPKGSSETICSMFALPNVSVIGFKKEDSLDETSREFLNYIRSRVPLEKLDLSEYQSLAVRQVPIITNKEGKNPKGPPRKRKK